MTQAKSFLKEIDFTKQELEELIDLSIKFKQLKKEFRWLKYCLDF